MHRLPAIAINVAAAIAGATVFAGQPPDNVSSDSSYNTAMGTDALYDLSIGSGNTASGTSALLETTTGSDNTATGDAALGKNTNGSDNTET